MGDYDNDSDLDILLTGIVSDAPEELVAKVYANTDGVFADIGADLAGVYRSSAAGGDYDNDGDLDILLAGVVDYVTRESVAKVYANTEGVFVDIGAGLTGVFDSALAWGDYDSDGDLDILLAGVVDYVTEESVAKVYANINGTFSDIEAGLAGIAEGSATWGDYDSDGDLDILLAGISENGTGDSVAKVYANTDGTFSEIGTGITGVHSSTSTWGDYDNDGDLDILLTGYAFESFWPVARVYANTDGTFTDIRAGLFEVQNPVATWADFDNDGDLDILLSGEALGEGYPVTRVYENLTPTPNTLPTAPGNLATTSSMGTTTFEWDAATDAETPSLGLSYNVRIGTTPGGNQIASAMADGTNGYRRVVGLGNAQQRTSWTLTLPPGIYYWSAQAIDGNWAGSAFAAEQVIDAAAAVTEDALPKAYALRGLRRTHSTR
ncbi:MAG: VCBS repeat-containing protein [bacterium]|nr:VCBS repeat-containing protein [bacterium]